MRVVLLGNSLPQENHVTSLAGTAAFPVMDMMFSTGTSPGGPPGSTGEGQSRWPARAAASACVEAAAVTPTAVGVTGTACRNMPQ
jgi:hypothetical protein